MEIIESFAKGKNAGPVALTIGVFDGVHLGHQTLLKTLKAQNQTSTLITFKNHPKAWILKTPTQNIHPFPQRIGYLAEQKIDTLYALEFNEAIRSLSAKEFLKKCAALFDLQTLVLGHDTAIGSDRILDPKILQSFVPKIVRVPPLYIDGVLLSSQKIRSKIIQGDLKTVSKWLGKPYVLQLEKERFDPKAQEWQAHDLALPPAGTWKVQVDGKPIQIQVTEEQKIRSNIPTEKGLTFQFL